MRNLKIVMAVMLAVVFGCTEDRVLRTALKPEDQVIAKKLIDEEALFLYTPTNLETSRTARYGQAYQLGQAEVVKFQINEFTLDVVAVERDSRFADNVTNNKLIMSIPIQHVDYRCQDDAYGECIGNEVEDDRIPFSEKKYIRPNFEDITNIETQFFESEFAGRDSCYSLEATDVESRSFAKNEINFVLQRHYKDNLYFFCLMGTDTSNWNNLNWSAKTGYSFVRLDEVASADYEPAVYDPSWERTFGFFTALDYKLDLDGNRTQDLENQYIKRWNPNRKEIVYNLSESFNKPENAVLKKVTYEAFDQMNKDLASAGVKFRLKIKEYSPDVDPHDLRNTMLVLVDDPLANSILGYGPSTANPLTGEVVSARTIMYGGVIKQFIKLSYDEIIYDLANGQDMSGSSGASSEGQITLQALAERLQQGQEVMHQPHSKVEAQALANQIGVGSPDQWVPEFTNQVTRVPQHTEQDIAEYVARTDQSDYIYRLAKQNRYPSEMIEFGEINQDIMTSLLSEVGELKRWVELSQAQRQKVLDILLPYAWVPTLVHEVGHNLGLRHNFSGSEDEDNYYSHDELVEKGVASSGDSVPYSSIMDYPRSDLNALRTFGKYDLAALRFGYTSTVEDANGKMMVVDPGTDRDTGITEELKFYQYCSDEGIAPNPTCNPFDEGSGYKAVAESIIHSYKERYFSRNLRNERANFSTLSDHNYLFRVRRTMRSLRLFYETYESFVRENQLTPEDVQEIPFLVELDETVTMIAQFFLEVIATPDTTCVISEKATGNLSVVPIEIFAPFQRNFNKDCRDLSLVDAFEVVGEAGRSVNSYKLPSNPNVFADQIDVRGTWVDKLVAVEMLFNRTLGSSIQDEIQGNLFDHPGARQVIGQFFNGLMNNQLTVPTEVRLYGSQETAEVPLRVDLAGEQYEIHRGDLSLVNFYLGVPFENQYLPELFATKVRQGIAQGSDSISQGLLKTALRVHDGSKTPLEAGAAITGLDGDRVFAYPESSLSFGLIANKERSEFYEASGATREILQNVLVVRQDAEQRAREAANSGDQVPDEKVAGEVGEPGDPILVDGPNGNQPSGGAVAGDDGADVEVVDGGEAGSSPTDGGGEGDTVPSPSLSPEEIIAEVRATLPDVIKPLFDRGAQDIQQYLENPTASEYYTRILRKLVSK